MVQIVKQIVSNWSVSFRGFQKIGEVSQINAVVSISVVTFPSTVIPKGQEAHFFQLSEHVGNLGLRKLCDISGKAVGLNIITDVLAFGAGDQEFHQKLIWLKDSPDRFLFWGEEERYDFNRNEFSMSWLMIDLKMLDCFMEIFF